MMGGSGLRSTGSVRLRIGICLALMALAPGIHPQSNSGATPQSAGDSDAPAKAAMQPVKAGEEKQRPSEIGGQSPNPRVDPDPGVQSNGGATPPGAAADSDAAAKAERKQRFEEAKRRLEDGDGPRQPAFEGFPNADLLISPIRASLLIGQERSFDLLYRWQKVLQKAIWRSSDPSVAEVTDERGTIIAKAAGK